MECDILPVLFDVHRLSPFNTISFLLGLAEAASKALDGHLRQTEIKKDLRLRQKDLISDPFGTFALWVKEVQKRLQGTELLFLIDEFTTAEELCNKNELNPSFFDGLQW